MTTNPKPAERNGHFLTAIRHGIDHARRFDKDRQFAEVLEHLDAIERLITAYRSAIGAPADQTEAHPSRHRWCVEHLDGLADEWVPGTRFLNRHHAVERYEAISGSYPTWKDGTPVQRRIVRETTSYTVEEPRRMADEETTVAASGERANETGQSVAAPRAADFSVAADTAEGIANRLHREGATERSQGAYDVMDVLRKAARTGGEAQPAEETGAALARYIADQPMSTIQAALRILGWPSLRFEVADEAQQPATPAP